MPDTITICPEPAQPLVGLQECDLLRRAVRRNPASTVLRVRLARLLNRLDAFEETIALLTDPAAGDLDYDALATLSAAYLGKETREDSERACTVARRAAARAANDEDRAAAGAAHAKALLRLGEPGAAVDLLTQALALDPHNREACRRLVTHLLASDEPRAVLELTDKLMADGVTHARLFAARTLAFAQSGDIAAARQITGPRDFRSCRPLAPPPGWDSIACFNLALVEELGQHPGVRYERYGTSSRHSWRIDAPTAGTTPLAQALLARITQAVRDQVNTPYGHQHPWLAIQPATATIRSWCVIAEGAGFEEWHMHPFGWLSGGYYVQVPAARDGDDRAGCIAFGLPAGLIGQGAAAAFGEEHVRPEAGSLMLFPSHTYHRTYPHGDDSRRICIAFDVCPA